MPQMALRLLISQMYISNSIRHFFLLVSLKCFFFSIGDARKAREKKSSSRATKRKTGCCVSQNEGDPLLSVMEL